jgi:hypothetical protein
MHQQLEHKRVKNTGKSSLTMGNVNVAVSQRIYLNFHLIFPEISDNRFNYIFPVILIEKL